MQMEIDTGNASPMYSKARPLRGIKKEQIEEELKSWISEGILEPVTGPVEWASPIHAVQKTDGSWRVCGDFRRLNSVTRTDRFPLPDITRFNESLHGERIFSKIDLARADLQIDVAAST